LPDTSIAIILSQKLPKMEIPQRIKKNLLDGFVLYWRVCNMLALF